MRSLILRVMLVTMGTGLGLLGVELGYRLYSGGGFHLENYLMRDLDFLHTHRWPTDYHPKLGWVPRSHNSAPGNVWGIVTGEHGTRSNGPGSHAFSDCRPHVLAVGDSFTWGDEVGNEHSWPAHLERGLGARVINAGVYNYGLDQTYLRLVQMLEAYEPRTVAIGVFGDDLHRAALSKRHGLAKPYFELRNGVLELRNVPVPKPPSSIRRHGPVLGLMAHSLAAHTIMKAYYPELWLVGKEPDLPTGEDPLRLGCEILRKMDNLLADRAIPAVLVLQYSSHLDDHRAMLLRLLECAAPEHVRIVDTYPALKAARDERPDDFVKLVGAHMTALGNEMVAGQIASVLRSATFPQPSCE